MATPSCHSAARNLLTAIFCHCEQVSLWRNRLARSAVNRKVGGSSPPRDASFGPFNVHCYYYLSPHTRLGIHPTKAPRGLGRSRLAQSVEHQTLNLRVVGSSPTLGDFFSFSSLFVRPTPLCRPHCHGNRHPTCSAFKPVNYRLFSRVAAGVLWCSGYHVCFTRRRSRVRSSSEPELFLFLSNVQRTWCLVTLRTKNNGPSRELNPGPLAPEAKIIPLDHLADARTGFTMSS